MGGQPRNRIAALDVRTGDATAWNQNLVGPDTYYDFDEYVDTLAVSGSTVYAGGGFTSFGGQARNNIAALDPTTGSATAWNPNPDGDVQALALSGSTVYAGGSFTSIGGRARDNLAALNAGTGQATAWKPNAGGKVDALALSGPTVYAGGGFGSIGGRPPQGFAAFRPLP